MHRIEVFDFLILNCSWRTLPPLSSNLPFKDGFTASLAGSVGRTANTGVGDWAMKNDIAAGDWSKALLHAGIGAAQAQLTGQDATAGAIGGASAELLAPANDSLDAATGNKLASELLTVAGAMGANQLLNGNADANSNLTAAYQAQQTDRNNRQLHIDERKLLQERARKIALEQAKARGQQLSQEGLQAVTAYWYEQLSAEATARMDVIGNQNRNAHLNAVASTKQPGLEGVYSADSYLNDAAYARTVVAGMAGQLILDNNGNPIMADGGQLKTFQATTLQQYQDYNLLGTTHGATLATQFGQKTNSDVLQDALSSAYANQQARLVTRNLNQERLEALGAVNGAATPVNLVEENLLFGMAGKAAGMAVNGVKGGLLAEKIAGKTIDKKLVLGNDAAKEIGASFANEAKLLSHFEKHGGEFGAKSASEYLEIGRDIMQYGQKVEYLYKGETRIGFVQFMNKTSKGDARFGLVGTNSDGAITTIFAPSGKNFWKANLRI